MLDGMVAIDGLLDAEGGEIVLSALDSALAAGRGSGDGRTTPQRRRGRSGRAVPGRRQGPRDRAGAAAPAARDHRRGSRRARILMRSVLRERTRAGHTRPTSDACRSQPSNACCATPGLRGRSRAGDRCPSTWAGRRAPSHRVVACVGRAGRRMRRTGLRPTTRLVRGPSPGGLVARGAVPTSRIASCGAGATTTRCTRVAVAGPIRRSRDVNALVAARRVCLHSDAGRRGVPRRRGNSCAHVPGFVRPSAGRRCSSPWCWRSRPAAGVMTTTMPPTTPGTTRAPTRRRRAPSGDLTALEVDRSGRFAGSTRSASPRPRSRRRRPKATDEGITEDSISVTHIRVTLEDLEALGFAIPIGDPADQAEKFVGIINDRCGGIHGRKLDLSIVEAPPLAPEGTDPQAVAQAACIDATEDNKAVFAYSGSGWGGQGGAAASPTRTTRSTSRRTTSTQQEIEDGGQPAVLARALARRRARVPGPHLGRRRARSTARRSASSCRTRPAIPTSCRQGLLDTLDELGVDVKVTERARVRRRQLVQHRRDRVGAGDDRRRRRRALPAAQRHQPARRTSRRW